MRRLRRIIVPGLLLALLVWGYTYEAAPERRPFVVAEELAWIRNFEDWLFDAYDVADEARADAAPMPSRGEGFFDCLGFADRVGKAPSERLERVRERTLEACGHLEQFVRTASANPSAADREWRRGTDLLDETDVRIYELFGYTSALPTRRSRSAGGARIEARLSDVASRWVGFDVEVRCFPEDDWIRALAERDAWYGDFSDDSTVGFADTDDDRIVLGPRACDPIGRISPGDRAPDSGSDEALDLADALVTFTHEITHVDDPDADEPEVECAAIQRTAWTGRQLGLDRSDATRLAALYWKRSYPEMEDEYRTDECRDGGALDERPGTDRWP